MKKNHEKFEEKMLLRLKKIEGQIRGIQKMVSEERECREIMQQLTAVKAAIHGVSQEYLKNYAFECLINLDDKNDEEREKIAEELVLILGKNSK